MNRKPKPKAPLNEKAVDLLSRRRLSRGELKFKLLTRQYNESEIEKLLDKFEGYGYLNDETLAEDYAAARVAARPMGKMLLLMELRKRMIPDALAQKAVDKIFSNVTEEELAERYFKKLMEKTRNRKKLWDSLARRGFQFEVIDSVMTRNQPDDGYEF